MIDNSIVGCVHVLACEQYTYTDQEMGEILLNHYVMYSGVLTTISQKTNNQRKGDNTNG